MEVPFTPDSTTRHPSTDPSSEHPVKVLSTEDGWCVAVGAGHYAQPLSREHAVQRASAIARSMRLLEIAVYQGDDLIETIAC